MRTITVTRFMTYLHHSGSLHVVIVPGLDLQICRYYLPHGHGVNVRMAILDASCVPWVGTTVNLKSSLGSDD